MPDSPVTVCIPTITTRMSLLTRAVASVIMQTHKPRDIVVALDRRRTGAAETRNRALARVTTEFVAFLDDDDELLPRHLELCLAHLEDTKADLVYPWFEVIGGEDPFPDRYGKEFDEKLLRSRGASFVPITVVARTKHVIAAGGFQERPTPEGWTNEDWACWIAMLDQGSTFSHLPRRTWSWYHHGGNTSGSAKNW